MMRMNVVTLIKYHRFRPITMIMIKCPLINTIILKLITLTVDTSIK